MRSSAVGSGPGGERGISQNRTRGAAIERRGLCRVLLGCRQLVSIFRRVCVRAEQMTAVTVRTCATVERAAQSAAESTQLGNVASCDHQYGQQLFVKHSQHIAEFFSMASQEMKD